MPFLKGTAREVTSIHLCPAICHLATIRDGSELEVANRHTLEAIDLGELSAARMIAFRPQVGGEQTIELAIVGHAGKPDIARYDVQAGGPLEGLPFEGATALQYSGDGRFLAAGNARGAVRVWVLGAGGPTRILDAAFDSQVECLAFHAEHPTLYATLGSGALVELPLAPSPAASVAAALRERAPGALFHLVSAGRRGYPIYLAGWDERVYVVDTGTGEVGVFSPRVGPITGLQVLPASGNLCVLGTHSVYVLDPIGPQGKEHLALVCPFDTRIYAAWELDRDALLVFHAAEGAA